MIEWNKKVTLLVWILVFLTVCAGAEPKPVIYEPEDDIESLSKLVLSSEDNKSCILFSEKPEEYKYKGCAVNVKVSDTRIRFLTVPDPKTSEPITKNIMKEVKGRVIYERYQLVDFILFDWQEKHQTEINKISSAHFSSLKSNCGAFEPVDYQYATAILLQEKKLDELGCAPYGRAWVKINDIKKLQGAPVTQYPAQFTNLKGRERLDPKEREVLQMDHVYYKLDFDKLDPEVRPQAIITYKFKEFGFKGPHKVAHHIYPHQTVRISPLLDENGKIILNDSVNFNSHIARYQKVHLTIYNTQSRDMRCLAVEKRLKVDFASPQPPTYIADLKESLVNKRPELDLTHCIYDEEVWILEKYIKEVKHTDYRHGFKKVKKLRENPKRLSLYIQSLDKASENLYGKEAYDLKKRNHIYSQLVKSPEEVNRYVECNINKRRASGRDAYSDYINRYQYWIKESADVFKIPFAPLACLLLRESGFKKSAQSNTNAAGLSQMTYSRLDHLTKIFRVLRNLRYQFKRLTKFHKRRGISGPEREKAAFILDRINEAIEGKVLRKGISQIISTLDWKGESYHRYNAKTYMNTQLEHLRLMVLWDELWKGRFNRNEISLITKIRPVQEGVELSSIFDKNDLTSDPQLSIALGVVSLAEKIAQLDKEYKKRGAEVTPNDLWVFTMLAHNTGSGGFKRICRGKYTAQSCLNTLHKEVSRPTKKRTGNMGLKRRKEIRDHLNSIMNCLEINYIGTSNGINYGSPKKKKKNKCYWGKK